MTATATTTHPRPAEPGEAEAVVARTCPRWDCSAEPVDPQPDSGPAPTPADPGSARRQVVARTCAQWDCLPEPAEGVVAPALELVA
ncbi:hypothetical protein [Kitasatospora sp. NPDC048407]|uniref:hypothetical protein n=1 Tax=Kitasatospora sp. NPDC048407 TaxID=3364051 RepID=UPI003719BFA6